MCCMSCKKKNCDVPRAQNLDALLLHARVCVFVLVLFCGAAVCLSLQATFAGGCLLITAINLPADSGLERHVAAAPRGGMEGRRGGVVKWVGQRSGREKQ